MLNRPLSPHSQSTINTHPADSWVLGPKPEDDASWAVGQCHRSHLVGWVSGPRTCGLSEQYDPRVTQQPPREWVTPEQTP
jgi:hypothetical protein